MTVAALVGNFNNCFNSKTWIKPFHSFERCIVYWGIRPWFKLTSPESNNNNWEKEFKFLYLSFEIEKYQWLAGFSMTEYPHKYNLIKGKKLKSYATSYSFIMAWSFILLV